MIKKFDYKLKVVKFIYINISLDFTMINLWKDNHIYFESDNYIIKVIIKRFYMKLKMENYRKFITKSLNTDFCWLLK